MDRPLALILLSVMLACAVPSQSSQSPVASPATCTPTQANGNDAPGMDSSGWWYGNNGLYAGITTREDGNYPVSLELRMANGHPGVSNRDKEFWVSVPEERMTVTLDFLGKRTNDIAPIVTGGMAEHVGTAFLNTQTWFPEPGCWRYTLTTPTRSLQITVRVVFPAQPAATP